MLKWNTSDEDMRLIKKIVDRAQGDHDAPEEMRLHLAMAIAACHDNGCPLDLAGLLAASRFEFTHDLQGIMHHLDRETGKLTGGFWPRYARQ